MPDQGHGGLDGEAESRGIIPPGKERHTLGNGQDRDGPAGRPPSRFDRHLYFVLMTVCIGLFVLSWAVLDRYSTIAAVVVSVVALAIPPFAAIIANAASAADRRRRNGPCLCAAGAGRPVRAGPRRVLQSGHG